MKDKVLVAFWTSQEFKKQLETRAAAQERSVSGFVRLVLLRELEYAKANEIALKTANR